MTPGEYPQLVTYNDLSDPYSVKAVNPNDLPATFGAGYAIKTVTLSFTEEPLTQGSVEAAGLRFITSNMIEKALADHSFNNDKLQYQLVRNDFESLAKCHGTFAVLCRWMRQ